MPVPEEKLYQPDRINLWFAVSSVLMAASLAWLIWVDYKRPWQEYQKNFYLSKAAFAHLDYLDAVREDKVQERESAAAQVAQRKEYLTLTEGARLEELRAGLADASLNFKLANGPWSAASQLVDITRDTYEKALAAHGPEHAVTKAAHDQLTSEQEEVERLRKEKEQWEDKKKQIEAEIKRIELPVREAEKKLREIEQMAESALQKDQQYRGVLTDEGILGGVPVVSALINAPLLDFLAPKNTPGRYQVNQLVLPQVRQQLNYLETYTTDRCVTCHVGIADPDFSMDRLARKFESALPAINEALQRNGHDPLDPPSVPAIGSDRAALEVGQVADHWNELTRAQQKEYFESLLERVNKYLALSNRKTIELGQPLLAHPELDLYVNIDSPHPMTRMGCTVCHEGNPQETDFVLSGHSPRTHEIEEEWKEKYYVKAAGVPAITFQWMSHFWDRPMRYPEHTEAGCVKCHTEVADISRFEGRSVGTKINLGRHIFTNVGCVNCHAVDDIPSARRVGPDLSHVASKLSPGFVQQWAFFPQKFRPATLMPHLFLQENNLPGSRNQFDTDPVLRTETEIVAMSTYLTAVSREWEPIAKPVAVHGDVERGRVLFKEVGCQGCHANLAENGEAWITADLQHRQNIDEETARFRYKGMTYEERSLYALKHFARESDTFFEPEKVRFNPEAKYNLPTFSRVGPELSGIGSKVTLEWLYSWLLNPTHYSETTRMPNMRLSPEEAANIAAYLMTLKYDQFEQKPFEMDDQRKALADELLFSLLAAQRSERRSRELLLDQGGELTDMLVSMLTPAVTDDGSKNSAADRQRAYDIVQGMSLQDKKLTYLGNKMISHYGCYACHLIPGFKEASPPGTNLTTWAQKPISQLDFAFYDHAFHDLRHEKEEVFGHVYPEDAEHLLRLRHGENPREQITHTHAAFAKHKMLNPRIWDREKIKKPYDKLKMPNYYFSEEEADALTVYLLSRTSPRVHDDLKIDYANSLKGPIAHGRLLTRELNCVGCHQIEDNAPVVQQYYRREVGGKLRFIETNAPPLLWGEGAKVQHHWLHRFFLQVETLRPWLAVRMPSFHFDAEHHTEGQPTELVEYFAALARSDADDLDGALAAIDEYKSSELRKADSDARNAPSAAEEIAVEPGADWFKQDLMRQLAAHLRNWVVERRLMRPADIDMLRLSPEEKISAHAKLLERVEFMAHLNDVDYPFVEPAKPVSAPTRFHTGQRFFNDMGCLKCHVFGNMLPGPAANTDEFVQAYRLDAVHGEGDSAVAVINGINYPVGAEIDGHKLTGAVNVLYESGDIETKAYFEGPSAGGEVERIMLQAASAPNLALTHQRLRRDWVHDWMLNPQWIQPGTKMPQNFPGGVSPFEGDEDYPGTGEDHINLLVDYMFDAGVTGTRSPQPKLVAPAASEEFDEDGGGAEEFEE